MAADWSKLVAHLQRSGERVVLSWAELDAIVGGVPATAGRHRPWWSGNRTHVRGWRSAGFSIADLRMGESVTFVRSSDGGAVELAAGDSGEQRRVEALMLKTLSGQLGMTLAPRRLTSPSGAFIDVDGVSDDGSVLVECWAHQGPAKVAQKYKLVNDAVKLQWAAGWLCPRPEKLLLLVSDEAAVRHLRGTSWQGHAVREMGVEIGVVALPAEVRSALREAQRRQYR